MKSVIALEIILVNLLIKNTNGQDPVLSISPATLPSGRYHSAAVYDGDDCIYILGGAESNVTFDSILKFTVSTERLESVATLDVASQAGSAIWDGTGVVYFGGYKSTGYIDVIRRYIPGESVTQAAGNLPTPTDRSTAVAINNFGEAYIFGGQALNTGNKIVRYSNNLATVVEDARLPHETYGSSSIHYSSSNEDSIYIFGGSSEIYLSSIVQYNVVKRQSSVLKQKLPFSLFESSAIYNGTYAYIIGGLSSTNTTNVIRFDPSSKEVVPLNITNFPNNLFGTSAVFVPKLNRGYIFGGRDGAGFSNQIMYLSL